MSPIEQQRPNPILRAAFPILVVFLFCVFSGVLELSGTFGLAHPLLIIGALGLIAIGISGRFVQVLLTPVGKMLALFTVWLIIGIPMAIWRGGAFNVFVNIWSRSFLAYVLTAGLILTVAQMRTIFRTIAYSSGFVACLALALHRLDKTGRLGLVGSRYENANEFGFTLVVGLIFLGFVFLRSRGSRKALAVIFLIPVLIALAKTGSRGCLLGGLVLAVFVFSQATTVVRVRLLIAMPILMMVLVLSAPSHLRNRYITWFAPRGEESLTDNQAEAIGSTEARLVLLKDSITTTIRHPLFGVGPGNFVVEQAQLAIDRGELYGMWHVTHNSYTELSSETGIPGLLIYSAFLFQCWKTLTLIRHRKYVSKDILVMSQTLRATFLFLVTVAIFDSVAYNPNLPILAGLITALGFIARDQRVPSKTEGKSEDIIPSLPEPEYEPALTSPLYN